MCKPDIRKKFEHTNVSAINDNKERIRKIFVQCACYKINRKTAAVRWGIDINIEVDYKEYEKTSSYYIHMEISLKFQ